MLTNDEHDETIEPVPLVLPLPRRVVEWLARHAADDGEAAEIAASMLTMIVDDDEAAHGGTIH